MRKLLAACISIVVIAISVTVFIAKAQEDTATQTNFSPKNAATVPVETRKSAKPRMVEVEEEMWFKLNQDILKMEDELIKSKTDLKVALAEIERLKSTRRVASVKEPGKKQVLEHRVRKNESLWKIALQHYNDAFKWRWIYKANIKQIDDPNSIYPEQILDVPRY